MKADVTRVTQHPIEVVAYESGDQPLDAVDIPPALINEWQKASLALKKAEGAIIVHLAETGQRRVL